MHFTMQILLGYWTNYTLTMIIKFGNKFNFLSPSFACIAYLRHNLHIGVLTSLAWTMPTQLYTCCFLPKMPTLTSSCD